MQSLFKGRILSFDENAALLWARLMSEGRPVRSNQRIRDRQVSPAGSRREFLYEDATYVRHVMRRMGAHCRRLTTRCVLCRGSDMSRIDLQVPFSEKGEARRLGARWDPGQRVWYVPANVDPAPLAKWRPRLPTPNIRASLFFLAASTRDCWRCAAATRVFALVLPVGHEVLYVGDVPADDHWQQSEEPVVLSYVGHLAAPVAARLPPLAPDYRMDFSQTTGTSYWMNHCEHCAAKLGDFDTVCEYDGAFSPRTSEEAAEIYLEEITEPFATACGGYTYIEWLADTRHQKSSCDHSPARHRKYSSMVFRTFTSLRGERS